jgi:hypothetical protein
MEAVRRKAESGGIWENYGETSENEGKLPRKMTNEKTGGRSFNRMRYDKHHE